MSRFHAGLLILLSQLYNVALSASLPALILPDTALVPMLRGVNNDTLPSNLTLATMVK